MQMLRTALFVLAIGAPTLAAAEEFPQSLAQLEVRGDDGTVLSRIESVTRDANGRVMAVEAPGLEPADAPADAQLVAQNEHTARFFIAYPSAERNDNALRSGGAQTRVR
jgi:hypothetical protein